MLGGGPAEPGDGPAQWLCGAGGRDAAASASASARRARREEAAGSTATAAGSTGARAAFPFCFISCLQPSIPASAWGAFEGARVRQSSRGVLMGDKTGIPPRIVAVGFTLDVLLAIDFNRNEFMCVFF